MRRRAQAGLLSVLLLGLSAGTGAVRAQTQPAAPSGPTARTPAGRTTGDSRR